MTEADWLTSDNLPRMLWPLRSRPWPKRPQFVGACWGTARDFLKSEASRTALAVLESVAESPPPYNHLDGILDAFHTFGSNEAKGVWDGPVTPQLSRFQAATLATLAVYDYDEGGVEEEWCRLAEQAAGIGPEAAQAWQEAATHVCALARCVFGNPFRPVATDPAWLTPTAVALAESIYAERAFDRLPILADAVEDAGCGDVSLLGHLRGPGPHVRGCWAVDLVLRKG